MEHLISQIFQNPKVFQNCIIIRMINNYITNKKQIVLNRYLHIVVIILFEFLGTVIFTYCTFNMVNNKAQTNEPLPKLVYFFLDFSLSMTMVISYSRQFSGGLFNPAVAFFRIFRKTERYPLKIALLYIICQILGGIVGALIALYLNDIKHAPITTFLPWKKQIQGIATNSLGTLVLTFMVQLVTEKRMTYLQHNRQFYVVLPIYYFIARTYSSKQNGVNPAFGIGFEFAYCYKYNTWDIFYQTYIFIVGPFLGAFISVMCFQYGMRPMFPIKKQIILKKLQQKQKQAIQLRQNFYNNTNNRWNLQQILNEKKYAPIGDQYSYEDILDEGIDDEIQSISDDDNKNQNFIQTDLQAGIRRRTSIVTNQYLNKQIRKQINEKKLSDYSRNKTQSKVNAENMEKKQLNKLIIEQEVEQKIEHLFQKSQNIYNLGYQQESDETERVQFDRRKYNNGK